MRYYEVLVGSASFHGSGALTYASEDILEVGQLVKVPLRGTAVLGVISTVVAKPSFSAKPLQTTFTLPLLPAASLQLLKWLRTYYPAPLGVITQQFLPKSLSDKLALTSVDKPEIKRSSTTLPTLTTEQKKVLSTLRKPGSYLLHGETGSGKTRVYLELAKETLAQGKSVIILTPEISLTSQLISFFEQHVAARVVVVHSQLTEAERRRSWLEILTTTDPLVIIGARSALFAPIQTLGLVVIDEAHETAYKQEQAPHYQTQRVASQLAQIHGSTLILGSATPSVADYAIATAKHIPILRMTQLARRTETTPPEINTIDLKDRSQFTRTAHLSNKLIENVQAALDRNEQSLLFLNRRGTARVTICQNCDWQALCPNCDLPLTYHGDTHQLRCHVCNYHELTPSNCPVCGSSDILFKSIGTKAIFDEVQRIFPHAKTQRFDTDNTKAEQFNQHFETVKAGNIDILIGTQTLAKGLDLPRLSVVGVIVADTGLYLPDYTANERTYQLLYQVVGRIGRGHVKGHAVIQTYEPENPIVQAVLTRDWQSFYDTEVAERQQFLYPPFCFLLKLSCRRAQSSAAQVAAETLVAHLRDLRLKIQISGPSPAFHEKLNGKFAWQVVIKTKQRSELLKIIAQLPSGWSYDIDPIDLL